MAGLVSEQLNPCKNDNPGAINSTNYDSVRRCRVKGRIIITDTQADEKQFKQIKL
jgi:hypothetical protein